MYRYSTKNVYFTTNIRQAMNQNPKYCLKASKT